MHADDVVLQGLVAYLQAIPGLEDHVTVDEEAIPADPELPWCWVQLGDFEIAGRTLEGKKFRTLTVFVDLITRARVGAMQAAGAIAAVIENRIDADPRLGGLVRSAEIQSGTRSRNDEASIARLRLIYLIQYSTVRGSAGTPTT
jgi:hypothetical protein